MPRTLSNNNSIDSGPENVVEQEIAPVEQPDYKVLYESMKEDFDYLQKHYDALTLERDTLVDTLRLNNDQLVTTTRAAASANESLIEVNQELRKNIMEDTQVKTVAVDRENFTGQAVKKVIEYLEVVDKGNPYLTEAREFLADSVLTEEERTAARAKKARMNLANRERNPL